VVSDRTLAALKFFGLQADGPAAESIPRWIVIRHCDASPLAWGRVKLLRQLNSDAMRASTERWCVASHRDQLHRSHSDAERDDVNNAHHNRLSADRACNGAKVQRRDALSAQVS
jgi:hypothetical protein